MRDGQSLEKLFQLSEDRKENVAFCVSCIYLWTSEPWGSSSQSGAAATVLCCHLFFSPRPPIYKGLKFARSRPAFCRVSSCYFSSCLSF